MAKQKAGAKKERKCLCDLCIRIFPMQKRIREALPTKTLREDLEYLMMRMMVAEEDRDVANAKLYGQWPGWEWIKEAKRKQEGRHKIIVNP